MNGEDIVKELRVDTIQMLSNEKIIVEKGLKQKVTWDQFFKGMMQELYSR